MLHQKGFSLIEVVVSMSIVSIIGLSMATIISQQSKSVSRLEDRLAHSDIKTMIHEGFSTVLACRNSFENISLSNRVAGNLSIRDAENNEILATGKKYLSLEIEDINLSADVITPSASNILDLEIVASGRDGFTFKPHDLKVTATLNGASEIVSCKLGASVGSDALDPSGNFRDGWVCSCTAGNGLETVCVLSMGGSIVDIWTAPNIERTIKLDDRLGFKSCRPDLINPPGDLPVLKFKTGTARPQNSFELCDMDDGLGLVECL
jgi:prepilin-type N-terminal cleavage/methylation domain-containing protein